jgi:tripartite-type tricarboxylate transporter receptor subunit TctC
MKRFVNELQEWLLRIVWLGAFPFVFLLQGTPTRADPVEDFYRGKTVNVYIGVNVGGLYDLEARLVAQFIGRHFPGHPTFVPQNMMGAAGISMANYLYAIAPKDGTSIGIIPDTLISAQAVGGAGIQYDASKFQWLGALDTSHITLVAWHSTGIKSLDDVRGRKVTVAATSPGATAYIFPSLVNAVLGTNLSIITGYQGTSQMNLAMQRGEVDAVAGTWSSLNSMNPQWLTNKDINFLVQGNNKVPQLHDVPAMSELAKDPDDKALVDFVLAGDEMGKPLALTPDVPVDRVNAMRAAFSATLSDPDFLAAAAKAGISLDPVSGDRLQTLVSHMLSTPKRIIDRAKSIIR